jgi:hypothetical protein
VVWQTRHNPVLDLRRDDMRDLWWYREIDHSARDDCAEQDDMKVPAGDGGSDEAKDTEEYAEMVARCARRWSGVHGGPAYICTRGEITRG